MERVRNFLKKSNALVKVHKFLIGNRKIRRYYENVRRNIELNWKDYYQRIDLALGSLSVDYFLQYGCLLGFIRDGRLIPWDNDIDFSVMLNPEFSWDALKEAMINNGFSPAHQFIFEGVITEQTYERDGVMFDFFGHFDGTDDSYEFYYYREDGVKYESEDDYNASRVHMCRINDTKEIIIDGVNIRIPSNSEEVLDYLYTTNWRIPNPNWKDEDCPGLEYIPAILGKKEKF